MKITKFFALMCAAIAFVGCDDSNPDGPGEKPIPPEPTGNLELTASVEIGEMGKPITFTVMQGEDEASMVDVTADCTIYNKETYEQVSNPFTPTLDGVYSFYAVKGPSVSPTISITVKEAVPVLPEDSNVSSTDFKHRALIIDHTGTGCGNCPRVFSAIKLLEGTKYHDWFYEAFAHSYNSSDPASSDDAYLVSSFCGVRGYPTVTGNFYTDIDSWGGGSVNVISSNLMEFLDGAHKEKADVGISASAVALSKKVSVAVEVKSGKTQEYKIACWLLEDNIYGQQNGASEAWHNTHNNAIRKITGVNNSNITGDSIGVVNEGETWSDIIEISPLGNKWVRENLEVMIIVTAANQSGKFDVANVAICPINSTVEYAYN